MIKLMKAESIVAVKSISLSNIKSEKLNVHKYILDGNNNVVKFNIYTTFINIAFVKFIVFIVEQKRILECNKLE